MDPINEGIVRFPADVPLQSRGLSRCLAPCVLDREPGMRPAERGRTLSRRVQLLRPASSFAFRGSTIFFRATQGRRALSPPKDQGRTGSPATTYVRGKPEKVDPENGFFPTGGGGFGPTCPQPRRHTDRRLYGV